MNRWLYTISALSLAVLLASCSPAGAETTPTEQAVQVAPPTATPVGTDSSTPASPAAVTADDLQRITPAEAEALLKDGLIALYDVRPAEDYAVQHAAGAISFPEADAAARTGELPVDQALVFY